jgi:hypothetical protein
MSAPEQKARAPDPSTTIARTLSFCAARATSPGRLAHMSKFMALSFAGWCSVMRARPS